MKTTIEVNADNFESEVLNSSEPVLVDFHAEWCGPCKMLAPVIEEIAIERAGSAKVATVDVDQNQDLAARLGIQSVPSLLFFSKGQLRHQSVGIHSKREILSALDATALAA
jgi:thioredoxin 1